MPPFRQLRSVEGAEELVVEQRDRRVVALLHVDVMDVVLVADPVQHLVARRLLTRNLAKILGW